MFIIVFTHKQTGQKEYYSEKKSKTNISKALSKSLNDATMFENQAQANELWKLYYSKRRTVTDALESAYHITIDEIKTTPVAKLNT